MLPPASSYGIKCDESMDLRLLWPTSTAIIKVPDKVGRQTHGRTSKFWKELFYYAVSHAHRSIAVRLGGRLENSDEFVLSVIDRPEKKNEGTAAENGILEAVQLLLEVGADINSLNTRGACSHW